MIISKKTKGELLAIFFEFGVKASLVSQFIESRQNKLGVTSEAFEEMSLEELKAIKGIVQYAIHEKEGVAS